MAKSLGGTGLPIGAMIYHEEFDTWDAGSHVGTFRGNAPAMIGGLRAIEYIESQGLLSHATDLGEYLRGRFREVAETTTNIVDVRGKGLFIGVEFVDDASDPDEETVKEIQTQCYENGVLVWTAGRHGNVLRIIPPLVLTEHQAEVGADIVCDAITTVLQSR